jgi:hypothetical protein
MDDVFLRSVLRLLITANDPSSSILVTLIMEAIRSSETSVLTRATRHTIPEDGIRQGMFHLTLNTSIKCSNKLVYTSIYRVSCVGPSFGCAPEGHRQQYPPIIN